MKVGRFCRCDYPKWSIYGFRDRKFLRCSANNFPGTEYIIRGLAPDDALQSFEAGKLRPFDAWTMSNFDDNNSFHPNCI